MISGSDVREVRRQRGWTQVQAAIRLRVSQPYMSLLETGRRPVSDRVLARLQRTTALRPTAWAFREHLSGDASEIAAGLAGLGYPGFAYLAPRRRLNPAQVLRLALSQEHLEARAAAALPWVILEYPDLDWDWLIAHVKVDDRQNRLGFVVSLSREAASRRHDDALERRLCRVEARLECSRLAREDSLGHSEMTDAERLWLGVHRSDHARRWNLLCDLTVDHLTYVA